jgi:hypothetical protein
MTFQNNAPNGLGPRWIDSGHVRQYLITSSKKSDEALLSYQGPKGLAATGLPDLRTLRSMVSKKTPTAKSVAK